MRVESSHIFKEEKRIQFVIMVQNTYVFAIGHSGCLVDGRGNTFILIRKHYPDASAFFCIFFENQPDIHII